MRISLQNSTFILCAHLLFTLIFHPSAWRQTLSNIDPKLSPDFSLATLKYSHWYQPQIQQLLLAAYLIGPLYIGIISMLTLLIAAPEYALRGSLYSITLSLVAGIISGITLSFAFSVVAALVGGLLIGLLYTSAHVWSLIAALCALGMASHLLIHLSMPTTTISISRRVSAVFISLISTIGLMLGSVLLTQTILSHFLQQSLLLWVIGTALGIGLTFGLYTQRWFWAAMLSVIFSFNIILLFLNTEAIANIFILKPIAGGITNGLLFPLLFGLPYLLAKNIADNISGMVAGLLSSGSVYLGAILLYDPTAEYTVPLGLLGFTLGLTYHWWKSPFFYLFEIIYNQLLYHTEQQQSSVHLLSWHSGYFDEHQWLPLFGLDKHLILVAERDIFTSNAAFTYFYHTPQRWAVLTAQLELFIRALEQCHSLDEIKTAYQRLPKLPETGKKLLQSHLTAFKQLSQEIAMTHSQANISMQQHHIEKTLDNIGVLMKSLTQAEYAEALRLCRIMENWREQLTQHLRTLNYKIEQQRQIKNPYITGVPLTTTVTEVFVGRHDMALHIEQLLQTAQSSPILLLGQRRMGKTSLLNHLELLLNNDYVPIVLDLQGISTANHAVFFYNIARVITRNSRQSGRLALFNVSREMFSREPFTDFSEWLDRVEDSLGDKTLLLAFDELESLENAFLDGNLAREAVLGSLRHIIQHRPRFKILLTGAYLAPIWSNYLLNTETLYLSYLTPEEARMLIEMPVKHELTYQAEAIEWILSLTQGHPALLQYLCKAIVTFKNKQKEQQILETNNQVVKADVEAVVPKVLESASQFFIYLQQAQNLQEQRILHIIAEQGTSTLSDLQALKLDATELDKSLLNLIKAEIVEEVAEKQYRFKVELVRRWFITR